jgi:hypothetical protein
MSGNFVGRMPVCGEVLTGDDAVRYVVGFGVWGCTAKSVQQEKKRTRLQSFKRCGATEGSSRVRTII